MRGPDVRAFAVYLIDRQHLPVERAAELLADLLDAPVSTGWLCQVQAEAAARLVPFMSCVKDRLGSEPVVHADETGTRVRTTRHWVHTLTTNLLTLIAVHPRRGIDAIIDIGVLPGYTGTIVHDGWASYDLFADAAHAQCGAHLIRHLNDVGETPALATWTAQMIGVLWAPSWHPRQPPLRAWIRSTPRRRRRWLDQPTQPEWSTEPNPRGRTSTL